MIEPMLLLFVVYAVAAIIFLIVLTATKRNLSMQEKLNDLLAGGRIKSVEVLQDGAIVLSVTKARRTRKIRLIAAGDIAIDVSTPKKVVRVEEEFSPV